jgi:hypothetical protein
MEDGEQPIEQGQVWQIGPVMWKPRPKDDRELQHWRDEAELRSELMQEFPDYFEKIVELAEAEAHYLTVKNLKKKDPPQFYEGRNRLYRARQAVDKWGNPAHDRQREHCMQLHQVEDRLRRQKEEAKEAAFYEPTAFKAWLRRQVNDHFVGKRHPERVLLFASMYKASAAGSPKARIEIAERYRLYSALWRLLQEEGIEPAIQCYKIHTRRALDECRQDHYSGEDLHQYPDGTERLKDFYLPLLSNDLYFATLPHSERKTGSK